MRIATAVVMTAVLSVAAGCGAPAAPTPTPTPEPTPTPVEVLATKPEHLAGIWFDRQANWGDGMYHRFEADGTARAEFSIESFDNPDPAFAGRFWFEHGTYYEESPLCVGICVREVYLRIEEGQAVAMRLVVIEESDPPCSDCRLGSQWKLERVD